MPAMPAPSTSTEVPFGGGDSLIGPLKVEVSAKAISVMAWYMAALPATTPIMLRSERRLGAIFCSVKDFLPDTGYVPRRAARCCRSVLTISPVCACFDACRHVILVWGPRD